MNVLDMSLITCTVGKALVASFTCSPLLVFNLLVAHVGIYEEMHAVDMRLQSTFLPEFLLTIALPIRCQVTGTRIDRLLARMRNLVPLQPLRCRKSLSATVESTKVISLICVALLVVTLQMVISCEGLATTWLVTDEGPFPRVGSDMFISSARSVEDTITVVDCTHIHLVSRAGLVGFLDRNRTN